MTREVKVPILGEGIKGATVTSVLVKVGDEVSIEQPLIEVESEKATLEVPSPFTGCVRSIKIQKGDQVSVGELILLLEESSLSNKEAINPDSQISSHVAPLPDSTSPIGGLVSKDVLELNEGEKNIASKDNLSLNQKEVHSYKSTQHIGVPAAPSVRLLSRELGVEIEQVHGTGPYGRISFQDVKDYVKNILKNRISTLETNRMPNSSQLALPDFENFGPIQREKLNSIRLKIAQRMQNSWQSIPHVTQNDEANISLLDEFRIKKNKELKKENIKLTVTAILLKGLALCLNKFPIFNASLDLSNNEVIYKKYIHIGVAVDTPHGLLVPVIRDVNQKTIIEICKDIDRLATKSREKKIQADEMQGSSFTLSNLGGLGTTYFTPIINWPEVAILGVGRAKMQVEMKHSISSQLMLPLSLSYDHRIIDGAQAARFLRFLADYLEFPLQLD